MPNQEKNQNKGFAGLNSMISNVDETEVASSEIVSQKHLVSDEASSTKSTPFVVNDSHFNSVPQPKFWQQTWFKWIAGLSILFLIISVLNGNDSSSNSSGKTRLGADKQYSSGASNSSSYETNYEEMPPVGSGMVLSSNQIRYCLSQEIRLDSWSSSVNHYSDFSVDMFNLAVNDYNSRCSNFRYKKYSIEAVRNEVESRRSQLRYEGLSKANLYH